MFDDSYTYDGRTEKDILQEAFNRIMNGVELPQQARVELLNACFTDFDRRILEKTAIRLLVGTQWKWLDFDKWGMIFKERKKYPGTWDECLYQEPLPIPKTVYKALDIFSFKQKKDILKELGIKIKPAPRTAVAIFDAINKNVKIDAMRPYIEKRYPEYVREYHLDAEQTRCRLLVSDFIHLFFNLRRYYQSLDYIKLVKPKRYKYKDESLSSFHSSIDKEYIRKFFNKKEILDVPPFYPGCPCSLHFDPT